ncbi:hypothetical protein F5Y12DRAFT_666628 [Xylaria sp. FL1777]|nr:hypothetical protein F5Y12DRAFT_666628 [Xylaria sp. FL1777]
MADSSSTRGIGDGAQLGRQIRGQGASSIPPQFRHSYISLRSTASRFSLNEQFAATRREYEFGYDDAASISVANTEGIENVDPITLPPVCADDFYDILCVSRDPSTENILRAYFRLFSLLDPDQQPPHLRQPAETYSVSLQKAFESLLDPCQQARINSTCYDPSFVGIDTTDDLERHNYNGQILDTKRHLGVLDRELSIGELGARFNIQQDVKHGKNGPRRGTGFELVDFEMRHATSISLSEIDWQICRTMQWLQRRLTTSGDTATDMGYMPYSKTERLDGTVLTIQGSVYGLLQDRASAPLSFDRYRSSSPHTGNRDHFLLLQNGLVQPLVAVNLRHVIPQSWPRRDVTGIVRTSALGNGSAQEETVVEIGSIIIPHPSSTIRISKSILLPFDRHRSFLMLQVEQPSRERKFPRLAATLERPTAGGQLLVHIASGDWRSQVNETCRYFADFTRTNRRFLSIGLPSELPNRLSTPGSPRVEITFKNRVTFKTQESYIANQSLNQGISALDIASDNGEDGGWTVTALAEPRYYSVSVKYAQDIRLSAIERYQPRSISPKTQSSLSTKANSAIYRRLRMEAEVGSTSFNTGYLAFRCLKRVGRFSKVGFEIGLGTFSLHLSVYWSRLGRRISVPFYLSSRSSVDLKILLLTTVIPFTSFALWELWDQSRHRKQRQRRLDALQEQQSIQKRRAEADTLMTLMAPAVQSKQILESAEHGLVILSAKYGVKARDAGNATAWGVAEVADVTVAVAALIDRGRLSIPSGVRKSYILGFWDPDPAEEKVLHVRYLYQGKENTVEVRGDYEQLVLPPPSLS